jgi:signal transduction histidine kinase
MIRRVMLMCALSFAVGALLIRFGWSYFRDLWLSIFSDYNICAIDYEYKQELFHCAPWPAPFRVLGGASVIVGAAVLLWLVRIGARRLTGSLAAMTETVQQLGPQNLGQRIGYHGPGDELRALTIALNRMLDRVATGYEGQRRFASNASHELRTPLAVQRTLVEVAMVTGEQDLSRLAAQLLTVNERNEQLIEGLLVLAESDRGLPGKSKVRFDTLVSEVLDRFASLAEKNEVTFQRGLTERTVSGDPVLLERMISNLVHNAIKYNEPGGVIDVVVAVEPTLQIRNTGQQVPAETVPALFEPFRRLSADRTNHRDGAGLGLSIVRSIVAAHDGTVSAAPGDSGGLTVTVHLP